MSHFNYNKNVYPAAKVLVEVSCDYNLYFFVVAVLLHAFYIGMVIIIIY